MAPGNIITYGWGLENLDDEAPPLVNEEVEELPFVNAEVEAPLLVNEEVEELPLENAEVEAPTVAVMEDVKLEEIQNLLVCFSRNTYKAKDCDPTCQVAMQKCIDLVSLDYSHILIGNSNGELSAHYPSQLIIMEYEKISRLSQNNSTNTPPKTANNGNLYESVYDNAELKDLFMKARSARCRARFPLPVILYNGKNICRSSTLSGGPEMYGRSGLDYFFNGEEAVIDKREAKEKQDIKENPDLQEISNESVSEKQDMKEKQETKPSLQLVPPNSDWQLFDRVRNQDIRLLKTLNVGAIIDLMVEKKKVKFGLYVSSSEKVDKEKRYCDFTLISLPYPGCEFFKEFRDHDYDASELIFDWNQTYVDATLGIPNDDIASELKIDWENYKFWNLIQLTQNYFRLTLQYLMDQSVGTLIHCISGWDRTPLFISLLRLSLWADGAIHRSLSAAQVLYFTIAYDWMLFGHNLADRLNKGEEIFFFCFYFLKFIIGEEFSVNNRLSSKQTGGSVTRTDSESQFDNTGLLLETDTHGVSSETDTHGVSSQESNISLNSSWSSISSKSHDTPPVGFQADELRPETSENVASSLSNSHKDNNPNIDNGMETPMSSSTDQRSLNSNQDAKTNNSYSRNPSSRTSPVAVPIKSTNIRTRNDSTSSLSAGSSSWQFVSGSGSFRCSGSNSSSSLMTAYPRSNDNAALVDSTTTIVQDESFIYNKFSDPAQKRHDRIKTVRNLFFNCYCPSVGLKLKDGSENSLGALMMASLAAMASLSGVKATQKSTV